MEDLFMKTATVVAVALAAISSFPSTAQQQPAQQPPMQQQQDQQMQQPRATTPNGQAQQQGQQNAGNMQASVAADQLKPVTGELVSKLDSKSAKQGDSVVVKTNQDLKFPGGAEIPKGSKLIGHVTNAQASGDGKANSQIAIQFDRAELKGGQDMAIESVIQSLSPAAGSGGAMDNSVPGNDGTSQASPGGVSSSSPGTSGSNSTTNSNSTMNQSTSNNHPGLASNSTAQSGATDQGTNSGSNSGMPAPGSIVARSGNVAIRTTSIPGILLANDINGLPFTNASGMLLGARHDIHLDGGTQLVVAVAAAPQGAGGGMSR